MCRRRVVIAIIFLVSFRATVLAQLTAGDVMFVGYNADGTDGFSIVTLNGIPANTTLYFTDNEWNGNPVGGGGAFNSATEGEITWDSGASTISPGVVLNFTGTRSVTSSDYGVFSSGLSVGVLSGTIDVNSSNEVIYGFLGTDNLTPTTFLTAIANDGFNAANGTLDGTGLIQGNEAISLTGDDDVIVYTGSANCSSTLEVCRMAIADPANWQGEGGSGDQSADTTFPDFPVNVASGFGGSVLPVELLSFSGSQEGDVIRLVWATASELNNDYFEISKSNDGIHFEVIGEVEGSGTVNFVQEYAYDDDITGETVYYQLRQIDFDGRSETFEVIKVDTNLTHEFQNISLYPNPVTGVTVTIRSEVPVIQATLLRADGRLIRQIPILDGHYEMNLDGVGSGVYSLILQSSAGRKVVKKLIVQ